MDDSDDERDITRPLPPPNGTDIDFSRNEDHSIPDVIDPRDAEDYDDFFPVSDYDVPDTDNSEDHGELDEGR